MKKNRIFDRIILKSGPCLLAVAALNFGAASANAHGFVGDRFFPPTIATDDPFATDELMLPSVSYLKSQGVGTTDVGFEFDKEIFPQFALGVSGDWLNLKPDGRHSSVNGFDNFTLQRQVSVVAK